MDAHKLKRGLKMTLKIKYDCRSESCTHTHTEESDITLFTLMGIIWDSEYRLRELHKTQCLFITGIEFTE
jgi:hypothetical protein